MPRPYPYSEFPYHGYPYQGYPHAAYEEDPVPKRRRRSSPPAGSMTLGILSLVYIILLLTFRLLRWMIRTLIRLLGRRGPAGPRPVRVI
jgi:hypothetical protein